MNRLEIEQSSHNAGWLWEMKATSTNLYMSFYNGQMYKFNDRFEYIWGKLYGYIFRAFEVSQDESYIIAGF